MKYIKTILFLLCSVLLNTVAHAQHSDDQNMDLKREIFNTFHKRFYSGEYPLRQIPTASPPTSQTERSTTRQASFNERVWFPGEWEEVKAIVLTIYYEHAVPGHEGDLTWSAEPVVKGWADYYHKGEDGKFKIEGSGPYTSSMTQCPTLLRCSST